MPHVAALYRYPVKGFTPEPLDELVVQRDGRIAGDRVLAFRFADAATPESSTDSTTGRSRRGCRCRTSRRSRRCASATTRTRAGSGSCTAMSSSSRRGSIPPGGTTSSRPSPPTCRTRRGRRGSPGPAGCRSSSSGTVRAPDSRIARADTSRSTGGAA
ncbi:hypothetical protein [Leucobacter soli]|uniref:hypothetical protein n=1 Tax=Leucobacter soli TaxID=2812850 RepID=UPI0036072F30